MPLRCDALIPMYSAIAFIERSYRRRSTRAASPKGVSFITNSCW
ncbi:hypothetical protein [Lysobacter gummosus]